MTSNTGREDSTKERSHRWPLPPIAGAEEEEEEEEGSESFEYATKRHRRYLFLVVGPRPYETSQIEKSLSSDIRTFGQALRSRGAVIRVSPEDADDQLANVAALGWPERIGRKMRQAADPFVLVIDRDFNDFRPAEHPWGVVWLSDYDPAKLYRVFTNLARITRDDDQDVFAYLKKTALSRAGTSLGRRVIDAIEIKPSVFGISLDVNAMLDADAGT